MIERNSNVPRIADRLVAKKFIERAASDINKGETVVTLTNDGMNILEAANLKVIDLFNSSVILKEEDASQLNLLLENMREKE